MIGGRVSGRGGLFLSAMAFSLLLGGCAGPSTRVLPREEVTQAYEVPGEMPVLEEVNPFYMQEEVEQLTSMSRFSGSRGESEAARYIQQLLADYGYTTERQRFRYEENGAWVTGTNVVAVREAAQADADILIVSSHHDSAKGSPGANENASGTAALLETARLLSRLSTDTELRFVSFSGHEQGGLGARYYVDSLSKREKERIIGAVDITGIGHMDAGDPVLGTLDGAPNMIGDLVAEAAQELLSVSLEYRIDRRGSAGFYAMEQIPAVTVTREYAGYEDGTPLDRSGVLDIEQAAETASVVSQAVSEIMSTETPSMTAKAHFSNPLREGAYEQSPEMDDTFGRGQMEISRRMGQEGIRKYSTTDSTGATVDIYQYQVKWFGLERSVLSEYSFRNGSLNQILLNSEELGLEITQLRDQIADCYGEPQENEGPYGTDYEWTAPLQRCHLELIPNSEGYELQMREYASEPMILARDGAVVSDDLSSRERIQIAFLQELTEELLPESEQGETCKVTIYTDGEGGSDVYLLWPAEASAGDGQSSVQSALEAAENGQLPAQNSSRVSEEEGLTGTEGSVGQEAAAETAPGNWELWIDLKDAFDETGAWRDRTALIRRILSCCGTYLSETAPQSCRLSYEEAFPEGKEEKTKVRPGVAPGELTQDDIEPPDFETAFVLAVLTPGLEDTEGNWEERVAFFYGLEAVMTYRETVRERLGLQPEKKEDFYAGEN